MLAYVEVVTLYVFKKNYILNEGKEMSAQTKLMTAKLRAVLACAESLISQISPRKFKRNNFNQFIWGPDGLD